jgi:hypothetical protein
MIIPLFSVACQAKGRRQRAKKRQFKVFQLKADANIREPSPALIHLCLLPFALCLLNNQKYINFVHITYYTKGK